MRQASSTLPKAVIAFSALLAASPAVAQSANRGLDVIAAGQGRVTGEIVADFGSRKMTGATGVDVYTITNMKAADLMLMNGTINRTPDKKLGYSVKFDLYNPKNPSQIAKEAAILRGDVMIDQTGRYDPAAGKLRIDVVKGTQSSFAFRGGLQGREVTRWWELTEQLKKAQKKASKEYSRVVEGKTITIEVKNADPLRFDGLVLAAGPFSYLPETTVRGSLDYDYELGNWLLDNNGLTLTYQLSDKTINDRITGSIRYAEETGSTTIDGKKVDYTGYYEYNLRFNESAQKADAAFFDGENSSAEVDAFFSSADQSKPGIYGRAYFADSEDNCKSAKDAETGNPKCVGPTKSVITYDLKTTALTYAQLGAWMKIEQFVIGPFTDE
ncbi:MAG: hypothetical protein ABL893_01045 [Hyphomicrobium sp.]|nr:hypothetical protein [Hyphomicrobium sp.]